MCIFSTSQSEPSISFQESYEISERILPFWNIFMASKNNYFDFYVIVPVKFEFRSVPSQLLQITAIVLLLLDLFNAWGAHYPHSLRYTVISCYICSTQCIFAVKNQAFFLQNIIFHQQVFLQTALKFTIIRILCTIPCSMAHALCSHIPQNIHFCYNWHPKPIFNEKSISGIITWIDFIWN